MSVWLTIPSARPPEEAEPILQLWRQQGYRIALWRDHGAPRVKMADLIYDPRIDYPGYAKAVNFLCREISRSDTAAEWFVIGGDDVEPDLAHQAEDIELDCSEHFGGTFGVMQPTGDRFAGGSIDRICGSAWIGSEFSRRINGGKGPLWSEYQHMFVDEELQNVALKYGCFWQRRDLIHLHRHFMRENGEVNSRAVGRPVPEHLEQWNTPQHWDASKAIFVLRKAAGFPGSEPL